MASTKEILEQVLENIIYVRSNQMTLKEDLAAIDTRLGNIGSELSEDIQALELKLANSPVLEDVQPELESLRAKVAFLEGLDRPDDVVPEPEPEPESEPETPVDPEPVFPPADPQ